jgi:hypothetical protein
LPGGDPQICTFGVRGDWVPGGTYTIHVPASVTSASGTAGKATSFTFAITKGDGCRVTATSPAAGSTTVSPSIRSIAVEFNSRINPASLKGVTFTGEGAPAIELDAEASKPGRAVFLLKGALRPATNYAFTLPGTVADVFGQSLGAPLELSFTTDQADMVMAGFETVVNVAKLRVASSSGDKSQPFENGIRWDFDAVGDFVELAVPAEKAGGYQLTGTTREYIYRGDFRISVNGTPLEKTWNQFDHSGTTTDLGKVSLNAGVNTLRFEAVNANPNEQAKPWLFIQTLTFSPGS